MNRERVISEAGPPPCESGCPNVERCRDQLLACRQYWLYQEHPLSPRYSFWNGAEPGRGYYMRVYKVSRETIA